MSDAASSSEVLVIRPGDKLLVRVPTNTMRDHVTGLLDALKERFPDNEVVVIAAEQLAVVRDGE